MYSHSFLLLFFFQRSIFFIFFLVFPSSNVNFIPFIQSLTSFHVLSNFCPIPCLLSGLRFKYTLEKYFSVVYMKSFLAKRKVFFFFILLTVSMYKQFWLLWFLTELQPRIKPNHTWCLLLLYTSYLFFDFFPLIFYVPPIFRRFFPAAYQGKRIKPIKIF